MTGEDQSERGCDCREIKPLKVMPCLIFRSANEVGCSLSQTSSRAAIIAGRGSELGRQKEGNITSPSVPSVCGGVVCLRPAALRVSEPLSTRVCVVV